MTSARPSLADATLAAYRDASNALRAMPGLMAVTVLALIATGIVDVLVVQKIVPAKSLLGREITTLVTYFLLTPFLIAVHRHVILGEVTRRYTLAPRDPRFQLFFGCTVVVLLVTKVPTALFLAFPRPGPFMSAIVVAIAIASTVMIVRTTILFPAIAVDAPGATWQNAMQDTKGHGWYVFWRLTVPLLLLWLVAAFVAIIELKMLGLAVWLLVLVPMINAWVVISLAVMVAIASRLYQGLGNRVGPPLSA
jgi:hypothetical protein